jgi:hypothetical protein
MTHNERYERVQEKYLETRDQGLLEEMYGICAELAGNYIRKYARQRGLRLDAEELAHDSAVYVIEQYLKKPAFRVGRISAYIHFGCVKSLFRDKERERRETLWEDLACLPYETEEAFPEESARPAAPVPDAGKNKPPAWKQGLLFEEEAT